MAHIVAKAFNSNIHRFKVGAPVSARDNLWPHNFDDLKARGFIALARSAEPTAKPQSLAAKRASPVADVATEDAN